MILVWIALVMLVLALVCGLTAAVTIRFASWQSFPSFCSTRRRPEEEGGLPVVMYHDVESDMFERELAFLKSNKYETITADALVAWLNGQAGRLPERPIVLTFDDGHTSLWTDAYPLLKRYGYQAIAFVCPWWIPESSLPRGPRNPRYPLNYCASWQELREMDSAGVINVQSHTHSHNQIWVDPMVRTFMTPDYRCRYIWWDDGPTPPEQPDPPWGWPILTHCPRFAHPRRFFPDTAVMRACAEHVAEHGGLAFFARKNWQDELWTVLGGGAPPFELPGRWETPDEQRAALGEDLKKAKRTLEEQLDKPVEHLAFPWNEASSLAISLAGEVGYRSVFRGVLNDRDLTQLGDDPMHIPRVTAGSFQQNVLSLPGRGRRGPALMMAWKIVRGLQRRLR